MIKNIIKIMALSLLLTACASRPPIQTNLEYPPTLTEHIAIPSATPQPVDVEVVTSDDVKLSVNKMFDNSTRLSTAEKWAFAASVIGHLADYHTTARSNFDPARGPSCTEGNLLLPDRPSDGQLALIKVVAIGVEYYIITRDWQNTIWYSIGSALIHGAQAYSNSKNKCYNG